MSGASEAEIQARILLAVGASPGVRIFRNTVGEGWVGRAEHIPGGAVLLPEPRRVTFGLCPDSADIVGLRSVTVTPDMVGKTVGLFVAVEVKKRTGRASDGQRNFLGMVDSLGGIAGVARSPEEAVKLLGIRT